MEDAHLQSSSARSHTHSHKRSFDAIGSDDGRGATPDASSTHAEGSRERNKRARNDSDSSYTSEVDDILLPGDSASPSSSSSPSSYHSARSAFPPALPSPLNVEDARDDSMQVDPDVSEANDILPVAESFFPLPQLHNPYPLSSTNAADAQTASYEEFTRSLERANAFDLEIAPLRMSPVDLSTSYPTSAGSSSPAQSVVEDHEWHGWLQSQAVHDAGSSRELGVRLGEEPPPDYPSALPDSDPWRDSFPQRTPGLSHHLLLSPDVFERAPLIQAHQPPQSPCIRHPSWLHPLSLRLTMGSRPALTVVQGRWSAPIHRSTDFWTPPWRVGAMRCRDGHKT
ncbi:hypothetical protein BD413DRAFT_496600 [Trametes elegans]|nr:hypothetical protein BD413DRAFT_496600 [Trametes elegans]